VVKLCLSTCMLAFDVAAVGMHLFPSTFSASTSFEREQGLKEEIGPDDAEFGSSVSLYVDRSIASNCVLSSETSAPSSSSTISPSSFLILLNEDISCVLNSAFGICDPVPENA
jgi:hypothetical protein